jgi:pyruvate dehydrogenase E1 component beta subunit
MKKLKFREAINEALSEEMARDKSVFLIGEDIIINGGPYAVTAGLAQKYPGRVYETPISEAGFTGMAVGAAMVGMRPVVELMYMDFVACAMDEVVNQAAKIRYMTGGQVHVPMVIRLPCGLGKYLAAQHSQSFEGMFMNVPGLQIAVPATPLDAKGLMKAAIRSPDPVLYFEYKRMYAYEGDVPEDDYVCKFGKADIKREGEDATVIAVGPMVLKALEAAVELEDDGHDIEVIDPRTLVPLDVDTIIASAKRTGRVVICEESPRFAGVGAEISAIIHEQCMGELKRPIKRIGALFTPMPFSPKLADRVVPGTKDVVDALRSVLA